MPTKTANEERGPHHQRVLVRRAKTLAVYIGLCVCKSAYVFCVSFGFAVGSILTRRPRNTPSPHTSHNKGECVQSNNTEDISSTEQGWPLMFT